MKHKVLFFAVFMTAMMAKAFAYDFSAVAPSGQTLYYDIVSGHAEVVNKASQNHIYGGYFGGNWISGDLIIPDTVYYNNFPLAVKVIQSAAFRNQSALHSVVIPNTVTSIGIDAFHSCSGLSSLTIPLSVTTIENSAFYGFSSSCTVVYTGSVAQWCNITFSNEHSNPLWYSHKLIISGVEITDLVIPEGVTEIKQNTFVNYSQLKLVTIPSTVTAIGYNAFYNCYKLQPVTIPTTVTSIGVNAFYNVPMLLGINSSFGARCINGYIENGLYYTNSSKTTFVGASPYLDSIIIPNTVTTIVSKALYGYDHIRYLSIPSSVTNIGTSAFQNVPIIYYYGTAIGRPWGARAINAYEENGFYYTSGAKDTIVYVNANLTNIVIVTEARLLQPLNA